jgi:hypothetical protein
MNILLNSASLNIYKPQEHLTLGWLTANPFILIRSTSFGVLVDILQGYAQDQEQVYPIVSISLHRMDEKGIHWQNRSKKDHDNNQLGGSASPMYLDKYFIPFCFTISKFAIHY